MTDKQKKTPFDLLHVRQYESGDKKKTVYTRIGVAFEIEGGFSISVDEGLALTGRAIILPRKEREQGHDAD